MHVIPLISILIFSLLLAAVVGLVVGLRSIRARVAAGDVPLPTQINGAALLTRGLLLSRLLKRPASGVAHVLIVFAILIEIVGHVVAQLSFAGIPVYDRWVDEWFMKLGREIAGLMLLAGLIFMVVRRLAPPERLTVGKSRPGFTAMDTLLLVIVCAGFGIKAFSPVTSPEEFFATFLASGLQSMGPSYSLVSGMRWAWCMHGLFALHGLLTLSFIALIPRTPMSHMFLGLVNSAFAPRRSGITLRAIDFEAELPEGEQLRLGAAKLADLSQKNLLDLSTCLWCGRCHEACPAAQTGKPLSPKKIMLTCAEYLQQGRTQDAGLIDELGMNAIFDCTSCAACVEQCPVSINPAEVVLEFRRHFVMERSQTPPTMAAAIRNLESRGHPFVGTSANPEDWRKGLSVPFFEPGRTEYLLWLGCSVTYEERAQHVARAVVKILEAAGVSYGILRTARCTGDPAKMMGNEMQFDEMAQANIEDFKQMRVQKVITICAHCFNSFDRYYPELGAQWETIPHAVLIDRLIRDGKLAPINKAEKITFHDPCYLARHNDIVTETRSLVSAVGQLVEMPRNRKNSFCCGAGGGNYWGGDGGTARIGDVRAEEALATGADKIATSCPFCLLMLTASTGKHTAERKVYDLAELVAAALPAGET